MEKNIFLISFLFIILAVSGCVQQLEEKENEAPDQSFASPVIDNIGIEIDFYDDKTNMAGDLRFDTFTYSWGGVYNTKVFYDYGETRHNENGTIDLEPQPIFIVPLGTKVHAITSGKVIAVKKLYSNDYTIQMAKNENPEWIYEHEHVINPLVSVGDFVNSGQIIAEVSNYSQWLRDDGYGVLDIGILTSGNGTPLHHCPFIYINESFKQDILEKITALYSSWEEYTGNTTLYDEDASEMPGCIITEPIAR